jgi:hypothetical protein
MKKQPPPPELDDLLTFEQAALFCHLRSAYKLREAVRRKELQVIEIGKRTWRFERGELTRWLHSKKTQVRRL